MKNPEKFPWKNHLPEHLPKENLWENVLNKKTLDEQVTYLKPQLPIANPRHGLWKDIEKRLDKRKSFVIWGRIVSAAAMLLFGLWGAKALLTGPLPSEAIYLTTELSGDFGKNTPIIAPMSPLNADRHKKPDNLNKRQLFQYDPKIVSESIEIEEPFDIQIEIPQPELLIAEVVEEIEVIDEITESSYKGKKTIAITWDQQPKRIKIDGFKVDLSEEEIKVLQELEKRKKGKFKVHINALTARLYEK